MKVNRYMLLLGVGVLLGHVILYILVIRASVHQHLDLPAGVNQKSHVPATQLIPSAHSQLNPARPLPFSGKVKDNTVSP